MKNTMIDVHNMLMEQLQRLNEIDTNTEAVDNEIKRASSMVSVSNAIVNNANVMLQAVKIQSGLADMNAVNPLLLGKGNEE